MEFRLAARTREPDWHNGPVDDFGAQDAQLLIVGLAPGLSGANRTGRPFTGDYAGDVLYAALLAHGFARGQFQRHARDGLQLMGVLITNAVRCVPPQNKPLPAEIKTCRPFLADRLTRLTNLKAVLALGRVAHESIVRATGAMPSRVPFQHGGRHTLRRGDADDVVLFNSYHCSRYNINTGVLTPAMFNQVMESIASYLRQ